MGGSIVVICGWHQDGCIQIADRSKDIISGGENISSVEIQDVLYAHPDVADAAVVARQMKNVKNSMCLYSIETWSKTTEEFDEFEKQI